VLGGRNRLNAWKSRGFVRVFFLAGLLALPAGAHGEEGPASPVPGTSQSDSQRAPEQSNRSEQNQTPEPASRAPDHVPVIDLAATNTDNLRLLYFSHQEDYLTPWLGRAFENALAFHENMWDWRPWERTTMLLKDFGDYGNAAARSSPNDAVLFDIAPLSLTFETFSPGERFFTLVNHELTHVATMDVWNSQDAFWRHAFFGKPMPVQEHPESIIYSYLTTPRVTVPRWLLEGSAVFMETWMSGGYGRAQGGYDEMVFRAMVRDNAYFYSPLGLESEGTHVDFQVGVNNYLYGTRFFSYLALTYSPEQVVQWMRRDEGSAAYYAVQFQRVFGLPLNEAWRDWIAWEHDFQQENLQRISQYPLTPTEPLSQRPLGSVSRSYVNPATGDIVGAFRYPGVIAHVGVLSRETGEVHRLTNIKGPMLYRVTSLAYDPASNTAWYTTDNYAYRDIMQLDVATGRRQMLIRDGRIGDIVFDQADGSIWGLRHLNGYVTLVRIPPPHTHWNQIHTFDFGTTAFDLDVSPDGTLLSASVGTIDGRQSVRVYRIADLERGVFEPIQIFELGESTPEGFVFSPDGRYLYGTSYLTGVSNVFRFDVRNGGWEAVTNAETGFFRPIPQADGSLIVFEYTGGGLQPMLITPEPTDDLNAVQFLGTEVANEHPVVRQWQAGSPNHVDFDAQVTSEGRYRPQEEMGLGAAYPVVEGYRGYAAYGYHAVFEDPLQLSQLNATVSFSPEAGMEDQNWHVDLEYRFVSWTFRFRHNDADFYDLFGPTERSRRGNAFSMNYHNSVIYDPPRELVLDVDAAFWSDLDTLPAAQTVATQFDTLATGGITLHYTNTQKSLGAVDHERGIEWDLATGVDYANHEGFPSLRVGFNGGLPLPIHNSSVWLYTAAGTVGGSENSPLSNFYLGSFRNNYVDDREVKRYREYDSFPGFDIDEIDARQFVRAMAEVNLPPLRFREVGIPAAYLSSIRSAAFAGILHTEPNVGDSRDLQTVGGQLDLNFTVGHRLPMTLSLGYAQGFEEGERQGDEFMISFKIM